MNHSTWRVHMLSRQNKSLSVPAARVVGPQVMWKVVRDRNSAAVERRDTAMIAKPVDPLHNTEHTS